MILYKDNRPFKLGIFGASGFAREIADIALELKCDDLVFILPHPEKSTYFEFSLVSEKEIPRLKKDGFLFAIGIGDNTLRETLYKKFSNLSFPNIIHPSATMGYKQPEKFQSKKGNTISAGVRLMNNILVGNFGIYDLNCTVGHDCNIGNFINIAPGANIAGNVCLEEGVFIGSNAAVLQGKSIEEKLVIGSQSTVGAGAAVTKNIPPYSTAVGVPAKVRNEEN